MAAVGSATAAAAASANDPALQRLVCLSPVPIALICLEFGGRLTPSVVTESRYRPNDRNPLVPSACGKGGLGRDNWGAPPSYRLDDLPTVDALQVDGGDP